MKYITHLILVDGLIVDVCDCIYVHVYVLTNDFISWITIGYDNGSGEHVIHFRGGGCEETKNKIVK